jgi:hypothetical protein
MHFIKVVFVVIKSHLEMYTTIWFFKYRIFSIYDFLLKSYIWVFK